MKSNSKEGGRRRKPYMKPEVKKVNLTPEEAVLGFCKTSGKWGPVASNCKPAGNCHGMGS